MPNPPKTPQQRAQEGGTTKRGAVSHRKKPPVVKVGQAIAVKDTLPVPLGVELTTEGSEMWDLAVQALAEDGLATNLDVFALASMCISWGIIVKSHRVLFEQGYFAFGSTGQMRDHPAMRTLERHQAIFKNHASDFGLTLLARARLGMEIVKVRTMQEDLNERLGPNPRRTSAPPT